MIAEIDAAETPLWLVLNKIDRTAEPERTRLRETYPEALQLSALDPADGAALHRRIVGFFDEQLATECIEVPYARQGPGRASRPLPAECGRPRSALRSLIVRWQKTERCG